MSNVTPIAICNSREPHHIHASGNRSLLLRSAGGPSAGGLTVGLAVRGGAAAPSRVWPRDLVRVRWPGSVVPALLNAGNWGALAAA